MYVVTIDQRGSRSSADRVPALLDLLAAVPCAAPFERTAGDEVQGLLDDPASVRAALLLALRDGDWHCGVGVGLVDDESFTSGTRAGRGPAYLAAREAVEAAKGLSGSVAVRSAQVSERAGRAPAPEQAAGPGAADLAADCEAVWALVAPLVLDRTEAQWRVVDAVDAADTQAAAAETLGITPSSVTGALRLSRIRDERAAYPVLDRLLAEAHAAATDADAGADAADDGADATDHGADAADAGAGS